MKTHISGGGGSSSPKAISTAVLRTDNSKTILAGASANLNFDDYTFAPVDTADYTYVASVEGGAGGVRINTSGLYFIQCSADVQSDAVGKVDIWYDNPPFNNSLERGYTRLYLPMINEDFTAIVNCLYATISGNSPDAITVGITNHTSGTVTTDNGNVFLLVARLGDSSGNLF